jgi:hypothetical protein
MIWHLRTKRRRPDDTTPTDLQPYAHCSVPTMHHTSSLRDYYALVNDYDGPTPDPDDVSRRSFTNALENFTSRTAVRWSSSQTPVPVTSDRSTPLPRIKSYFTTLELQFSVQPLAPRLAPRFAARKWDSLRSDLEHWWSFLLTALHPSPARRAPWHHARRAPSHRRSVGVFSSVNTATNLPGNRHV